MVLSSNPPLSIKVDSLHVVIEATKDDATSADPATPNYTAVGRIKEPPVCQNPSLKKEAMSSEDLSKLCFTPTSHAGDCSLPTATSASSASSISSRESDQSSAQLNAKVISQKTSRQGRETQRWVIDANSQQRIRLVTGCVPILNDGRILLVSASRKAEWILPKGGWELDETMEESAVRESFEEAGVLGTLGTKLSEIEYETRKSRKRKLELEETIKRKKEAPETGFSSGASDVFPSEDENHVTEKCITKSVEEDSPCSAPSPPSLSVPQPELGKSDVLCSEPAKVSQPTMSKDAVDRIRASKTTKAWDETSSIASDSSTNYSLVRMTLFPLYVREVKDNWPESGRFRKAVEIDDAIEMMKSRPEFHAVLEEVKNKGIHLVCTTDAQ
jgi:diphosphoinositol-polyphosphate diphosphatase